MSFRLPSANVTLMTTMCVCMWAGGRCIARSLSENLKSKHTCAPLLWYLFVNGNMCVVHTYKTDLFPSHPQMALRHLTPPHTVCANLLPMKGPHATTNSLRAMALQPTVRPHSRTVLSHKGRCQQVTN